MKNYCDLHSDSPENVLKQGAKEYIRKDTLDGVTIDNILSARMEQVRAHYNNDSNAQ